MIGNIQFARRNNDLDCPSPIHYHTATYCISRGTSESAFQKGSASISTRASPVWSIRSPLSLRSAAAPLREFSSIARRRVSCGPGIRTPSASSLRQRSSPFKTSGSSAGTSSREGRGGLSFDLANIVRGPCRTRNGPRRMACRPHLDSF